MKAWRLERHGCELSFGDVSTPAPRPGSVLVRVEAATLLSYLNAYAFATCRRTQLRSELLPVVARK